MRPEGLLGWIDDELWTCELAGIVEDDGQELIAERGRLLERVEAWNETAAHDFARACAARGREHVVEALRVEGYEDEARELGGLDVEGFVTTAPGLAAWLPSKIAGLVLMAADTTALAEGRHLEAREPQLRSHIEAVADGGATHGALAANVAFIVAHSTAGLHPEGCEAGFAAERAWQLERLVERLGVAVSAIGQRPSPRSLSVMGKGPKRAADLYGLPPEEFTSARNELARELKRAGKKEAADEVGALRKPTRSTWAVNQVARRRPQETRALVKAGDELRKAQRAVVGGRRPEVLAEAQLAHRHALEELTETVRDVLGEHGPATSVVTQAVQTLRAASIDKEASKDLVRGTLAGEVEQSGFGPLLAAVPSRPQKARAAAKPKAKPKRKPPPKSKPPPKPKPDPNIARRARLQQQLGRAQERVRELEARLAELGG